LISLALIICACVAIWLIWPVLESRLGLPAPASALRRLMRKGKRGYRRRDRG
jgi:hypothetical protein